jgi:hypothetical protein
MGPLAMFWTSPTSISTISAPSTSQYIFHTTTSTCRAHQAVSCRRSNPFAPRIPFPPPRRLSIPSDSAMPEKIHLHLSLRGRNTLVQVLRTCQRASPTGYGSGYDDPATYPRVEVSYRAL